MKPLPPKNIWITKLNDGRISLNQYDYGVRKNIWKPFKLSDTKTILEIVSDMKAYYL